MINRILSRFALNALALGDYEKAEKLFRKLSHRAGAGQGHRYNLAVALMAQRKYGEAEERLLEEVEDYGLTYSRSIALADLFYALGKRAECAVWYGNALQDCKEEKEAKRIRHRIGLCGDEASFRRAQRSLQELEGGRKHMAAGEYDDALQCFRNSGDNDPSQYQAWNEAGVILLNFCGDPAGAVPFFRKALEYSDLSLIRKNLELARAKGVP